MSPRSYVVALLCTLLSSYSYGQSSASYNAPSLPVTKQTTKTNLKAPGVALVLSGGGAKGMAHIGVLEILDSAHIPIDLIVGTSVGASIGGLYAAGYTPAQLRQFALTTNWTDVLDLGDESHRSERLLSQKDDGTALLSLRFTGFFQPVLPQALSSGQRLTMLLNSMVLQAPGGVPQDFLHDMRVPFIAVATDIVKGERRLITKGDLTEALRASATLPLRFNPLSQDSAILMDGGLLANIPVDVAREYAPSLVIVSNTTARLRPREELTTPWDVADQVISLMMQKQNVAQLRDADIVIAPDLPQTSSDDFRDIELMIEAGKQATRKLLSQLLQRTNSAPEPLAGVHAGDTLLTSLNRVRVIGTSTEFVDTSFVRNGASGSPLVRHENLERLEHTLIEDYRSHGFSLVRLDSVVLHPNLRQADFYIDEGRIGAIVIQGDDLVHPDIILRELPFSTGDIFHASDAERASQNLTGTSLFDFTTIQIERDTLWPGTRYAFRDDTSAIRHASRAAYAPTIQVIVRVRASNVIRLGVLADNEFGAQFSTELANENVAGTGLQLSLKGGLGPLSRNASFTIDAPRLFRTFATFFAQVYTGYRDINVYELANVTAESRLVSNVIDVNRETRDVGVLLRAGGQVGRLGAITGEIRHEQQRWFSVRDSAAGSHNLGLTALRAIFTVDTRNDAAYPHVGSLVSSYIESGQSVLGGESSYTKLYLEAEQAIPVSTLHTFIPRLQLGFGDAPLPLLERFTLGGITSFYGLNEYELRGKQVLAASLTYQIAIPHVLYFPTYVTTRYDLGSTWPEPAAIKFESLLHGLGAQVGLKTPLGLARFAIGENFRFTKNKLHPIDFNKPRFYFSIGSSL